MLELYEVTYNGKIIGQCHADDWTDAVWTMKDRMQVTDTSMDGWDACIVFPEPFTYISSSTEGY